MSDFHRPTYTFPLGAYNATEVRLYGKPGVSETPESMKIGEEEYTVELFLTNKTQYGAPAAASTVVPPHVTPIPIPTPIPKPIPNPIPVNPELKITSVFLLEQQGIDQMIMFSCAKLVAKGSLLPADLQPLSWGVIYSYAYEGHCYDLPKPKVMLLPVKPSDIPLDDAGYYQKKDAGYRVWSVDKLSKCIEIDVNQGFVEQLVLEANLPGQRAPSMYAAKMMMGHRSGRLSE